MVKNRFAFNISSLFVSNVTVTLLNFFQGILLAHWLGPDSYGIIALVMSYAGFVFTFFDARSSEVSIKYLSEFKEKSEQQKFLAMCKLGYSIDLAITIASFAVIAVTANWTASRLIHHPEMSLPLILYGASFIPRSLMTTTHAVLVTLSKFHLIAWLNVIATAIRVLLVIALVVLGFQVKGALWGFTIGTTIQGMLYGIIAYHLFRRTWGTLPLSAPLKGLRGRLREILKFLFYNDINAFLGMIIKQLDMLLIGYFRTPVEAGYFKIGKNAAAVLGYLANPLQITSYPELSQLWVHKNVGIFKKKIRQYLVSYGMLASGACLLCLPFLKWAIIFTVGSKYLPALLVVQILWAFASIQLAFYWLRPAFMATGHISHYVYITAAMSALMLVSFFLAIPGAGYVGAAFCVFTVGIMHIIASFIYLERLLRAAGNELQSTPEH